MAENNSRVSKDASFPKSARLTQRREFERLGRQGSRLVGRKLMVEALPHMSSLRLGVTVTKKYGKAHDRNRFKRCVREAFRLSRTLLPQNLWINVRPRHKEIIPSARDFQEELLYLLCR